MMRAEGRPPLASSKTSSKKEKGCAPDWHFADEADSSKDGSKSSSTGNRERKFIVRGAVVLVLMIGAMYM